MDLRVRELEERASNLESLLREAEAQVAQMKKEVDARDKKIDSLLREIHKLKSVLEITSNNAANANHANHVSNNVGPTDITGPLVPPTTKKQGVSGESATHPSSKGGSDYKLERHEKDFRWKQLIKDAILGNDFLQHLVTSCQVKEIVDCMYSKKVPAGSLVIREGEPGRHLYVSAEGELEVRKGETVLGIMGPGKAFGELAILYNCTRTATVKAVSDALLWVLDRRAFQTIMVVTGIQRQEENINFLKSVPLLKNLSNELLSKMADVLEVVRVTQKVVTDDGLFTEEEIRCLGRGEYFGEQALLREDKRTANVIAMEPGVECLTLNREISNMSAPSLSLEEEYKHIQLDDLDVLATLGVGGFGRVQLVQYIYDRQKTFALKILKKVHIVETQQQQHALSERAIMMSCKHPFICRKENSMFFPLINSSASDSEDSNEFEPEIFANNSDNDMDLITETGTRDLLVIQESDYVSESFSDSEEYVSIDPLSIFSTSSNISGQKNKSTSFDWLKNSTGRTIVDLSSEFHSEPMVPRFRLGWIAKQKFNASHCAKS
ncbi:cGMP-dependent protein kinase like protein [Argiope bruennichi]|uniref:cGMP-dependent protein kinase like protein n=1 Tax=Argiope bruennichi TaxID=94029 RepID=A0A8T0EEB6_ARGBR|nr:cGMP-dependent protein kinase like protein [Argiope bruennichi]